MSEEFQEYKRPKDLVDENTFRNWVLGGGGTLSWEADSFNMPMVAEVGSAGMPMGTDVGSWDVAIEFGSQADDGFAKVKNWVQVDDLAGMGALYCGSYGGKFYLSTTAGGGEESSDDFAALAGESELDMMPIHEGSDCPTTSAGFNPCMPRRACPMSEREKLLKVGGKWRSDVKWDTLINGPLSYMPPGYAEGVTISTPYRVFTLRLIQVGEYICFHSKLSTYSDTNGDYHYTGHSMFRGRSYLNYGWDSDYLGYYFHGWSAEPPWGSDISSSWQGEDNSELAAAQTPEDATTPYCRVFPRLHVGEGWFTTYAGGYTAKSVETVADNYISDYWNGGSPDWMEDFLGIDQPLRWDDGGGDYNENGLYLWVYNVQPTASPVKVFSAHLPHPGGNGNVYIALYTATIDDCLITSSCCTPYGYT